MELIVDGGVEAPKIDNDWGDAGSLAFDWLTWCGSVGWMENDRYHVTAVKLMRSVVCPYCNPRFKFNEGVIRLVRLQH